MRSLEFGGARVLNGSRAFLLELSKSAQAALLRKLEIPHPRSLAFNDPETALAQWTGGWPALLKPEQGGSGARMFLLHSPDELRRLLRDQPSLWVPDNLLLLQQYFPVKTTQGIVRMEFLGGKLLYAMRVVSHGAFNLCPSEVCNPEDGSGSHYTIPADVQAKPVEFYPYPEVPAEAVAMGEKIMESGGLDVGGIEYLEADDNRRVFYDVNANSNLRAAIGQAFGFDPFARVVEYLIEQIKQTTGDRAGRRAAYSQSIARLQQGASAAATTLLKTMIDPDTPASVRIRAAECIMNHATKAIEIEDIEARVAALEAESESGGQGR
jgi:hypothetical protein